MADKTIGDLPSVTNVEDSIAFPVEQSGVARRMTIGDFSSHIGSASGGAYIVTFDEYGGATTASANASAIFTQVTNNKSVELKVKTGANEYSVGKLLYVSKSGSSYSAFFEVKHGADVVKKYVIDQNANCSVQQQYNVAITNGQTTYTDPNHLTLSYVPSAGTDAVNKNYVDASLQNVSVNSVNGRAGDVVLTASDVGAYSRPETGIPKTDLAQDVQTSLGKADTALQYAPVLSVNGQTGAVALDANDVGALADDAPVLMSTAQQLTDAQKAIARANIGAASSAAADILYDIYAEFRTDSAGNYYAFTGGVNAATILSALNSGMIPVVRNNDNVGGTLKKKWYFSEYQDDGEDVYIRFFRGSEIMRYIESEHKAYILS